MTEQYRKVPVYDDFHQMLKARLEADADQTAISYISADETVCISYKELLRRIASVYFFLKEKLPAGEHIAILSENRYEYIVVYLAAVFAHVIVPLDKELDRGNLEACLQRFDVSAVFCTDKTEKKISCPQEYACFNLDHMPSEFLGGEDRSGDFLQETAHTDKDRFAILVSTSGTDGRMKGVMLSQYNVITNIRGTLENNELKNPTLAFLPMNHTYGFNPCILATFYNGTTLCLNLELKHLLRDMKRFDPFFFGAVPMVIEGIYDGILREVKRRKKEKQFRTLLSLCRMLRKLGIDLRHLFFGKLLNPRLRLVVNGGAALREGCAEKLDELGITILNGYGLTECSPTVAVSRVCHNPPGSAGTIMNHIEVKIAEDGEILVKGPCVMLGYYKDEAATAACMREGYLATGDLGYVEDRVIFLSGRKKNLIILENGKNVAPEYLEEKIRGISCVKECLVIASGKGAKTGYLKALLVLKEDAEPGGLEAEMAALNSTLPSYMRIEEWEIREAEFDKNSSKKIIRSRYTE